jgi:hypothetical protein
MTLKVKVETKKEFSKTSKVFLLILNKQIYFGSNIPEITSKSYPYFDE